ncbi:cyclophilin-like fold protein [candidate division KSB1 bacterium]
MAAIRISVEGIVLTAHIDESPTGNAVEQALPFEGMVNRWGEEIYFQISLNVEQEFEAREQVEVGDLGYWPVGHAFCIFFGPTPASTDERPRAASPVNVFGKVEGDATQLSSVPDGATINVEHLI